MLVYVFAYNLPSKSLKLPQFCGYIDWTKTPLSGWVGVWEHDMSWVFHGMADRIPVLGRRRAVDCPSTLPLVVYLLPYPIVFFHVFSWWLRDFSDRLIRNPNVYPQKRLTSLLSKALIKWFGISILLSSCSRIPKTIKEPSKHEGFEP